MARISNRLSLPVVLVLGALMALVLGAGSFTASALNRTGSDDSTTSAPDTSSASSTTARPSTLPTDGLGKAIAAAQKHLREVPNDYTGWAQLGSAYVQQARVTSDPSFYAKADGALARSLAINTTVNWSAMVGLGALANARHDFTRALSWGRRAVAINSYSSVAYGVINDALTQLGDYPGARAAVQRMLDLKPGIAAFARASYDFEERGLVSSARSALESALAVATDRADIAFCRFYLGELAFNNGHPDQALTQYQLGLAVDSSYTPLLAGRAKALAALGHPSEAVRDYALAVSRVPLPSYLLEYGELLESLHRPTQAQEQYAVLAVEQQLFAANGIKDDLALAVFLADHGSAAAAVQHARAEWSRRHSVLVADALGWALHRAGRDKEALRYAHQANALGWRNATFGYHLAMIELSLGDKSSARRDLRTALNFNPYFSIAGAADAKTALASQ